MTYLHFNTDHGREAHARLKQTEAAIAAELTALSSSVEALAGNGWQAPGAAQFAGIMAEWRNSLHTAQEALAAIAARLDAEIIEWEETAAVFGSGGAGGAAISIGVGQSQLPEQYNTDSVTKGGKNSLDYMKDEVDTEDISTIAAGLYLISHLGTSAARPNSITISGGKLVNKFIKLTKVVKKVGLKGMTRVIKPENISRNLAEVRFAQNAVDGVLAARDTYLNSDYTGTDSAVSAAALDGVVKFAIGASGTVILLGLGGAAAATLPVAIAGGVTIGLWTAGSVIMNKVGEARMWDSWKNSNLRRDMIRKTTEITKNVQMYVQEEIRAEAENIKQVFSRVIHPLSLVPA